MASKETWAELLRKHGLAENQILPTAEALEQDEVSIYDDFDTIRNKAICNKKGFIHTYQSIDAIYKFVQEREANKK